MRIFEIILKILFLLGSVYAFKVEVVSTSLLICYVVVCFVLGFVLIFNKNDSYNYPKTNRDWLQRRIEGGLLIIFSLFIFFAQII